MSVTINGTNGLTFADSSTQNTAATGFGFKNRIINGQMQIDQRNSGAEVNPAVSNTYYTDRWNAVSGAAGKFKIGQNAGSVTPPTGFTYYTGLTSLSAYSAGASEAFGIQQRIEGYNVADLGWGTANAATVTISFWVRSSLTGTFGGSIRNGDATRSYPFSYTISSANTWEQKSVTITGDTTGTWLTTSGIGMSVLFSIGAGSTVSGTAGSWAGADYRSATGATSVVGTSGATFYITGVQLEKGSTATSFDYRPYGTELALCQRYYYQNSGGASEILVGGIATAGSQAAWLILNNAVTMRSAPTGSIIGTWVVSNTTQPGIASTSPYSIRFSIASSAAGQFYAYNNNAGNGYSLSSEL